MQEAGSRSHRVDEFSLEPAAVTDGLDVLQMLWEIGPGENGFTNGAHRLSTAEYPVWLQSRVDMARGANLGPGHVPMTTYWLRRRGYPLGMSKLRPHINAALLKIGGHMGFCIRPSERRKGYASILVLKTLQCAAGYGVDRVLLTCQVDNTGSWRTIERCGGVLEKIESDHRYYWIVTGSVQAETKRS